LLGATAIEVKVGTIFTVCVSEAELSSKLVLPLYVAVMLYIPEVSVEVVNSAAPPLTAAVFKSVVPS